MQDFRTNPDAQKSRGLRDNNPLNVNSLGKNSWQGEIGHDGQEAIFLNVVMGIRAAAMTLYSYYYKHGWKTLYQIMSNYAPTNDPIAHNEPLNYATFVGKKIGVGIHEDIRLNYGIIKPLMRAMIQMELGDKYAAMVSDADLQAGIDAASEVEAALYAGVKFTRNQG